MGIVRVSIDKAVEGVSDKPKGVFSYFLRGSEKENRHEISSIHNKSAFSNNQHLQHQSIITDNCHFQKKSNGK
jgi:hypothetical protein